MPLASSPSLGSAQATVLFSRRWDVQGIEEGTIEPFPRSRTFPPETNPVLHEVPIAQEEMLEVGKAKITGISMPLSSGNFLQFLNLLHKGCCTLPPWGFLLPAPPWYRWWPGGLGGRGRSADFLPSPLPPPGSKSTSSRSRSHSPGSWELAGWEQCRVGVS